jgi:hypothetical protein
MPRKALAPATPLINFQVRLHAIGGGKCEFTGAVLPELEETLTVAAPTAQRAASLSKAYMKIRPMGQLLRTYVNGEEVLANA